MALSRRAFAPELCVRQSQERTAELVRRQMAPAVGPAFITITFCK
jgi:hypothetical protein